MISLQRSIFYKHAVMMFTSSTYILIYMILQGKAVFATAAIPKDQAIFEEEPLVCSQFLWNEIYKYKACEYCLRSLESAQEMGRRYVHPLKIGSKN